MDKKIIYILLVFLFLVLWIGGIIIGYKKGKKSYNYKITKDREYEFLYDKERRGGIVHIIEAYPLIISLQPASLEPHLYTYKVNIKDNLNIINEKGEIINNKLSSKYNYFNYKIIDDDLKNKVENKYKKSNINNEESINTNNVEHYKGFIDNTENEIKESDYAIYSNL